MSDSEYKGPGEVTTALGTGVKGYIAGGVVGGAIGYAAGGLKSVEKVTTGVFDHGVPAGKVSPTLSGMGPRGKAALVVGGTVATVAAIGGLIGGWSHASQTRKSWTERENDRAQAAALLGR